MRLIIVESPTKARTLSRFLGDKFQIEASMGHLRDLPRKKLGVDVEHNFEPEYVIDKKKQATVTKLKTAAKAAEAVILATDPDREGEAIAFHLQYILKNGAKFQRIVFHEITKGAIDAALQNPGEVDLKLFDSQQARRILDRLVGYKLSPLLWRKVRRGLSAGRVQSVAVRLVVEREQAIKAFMPLEYWEIKVELSKDGVNFLVQLIKNPATKAESQTIVNDLEAANYQVLKVDQKTLNRHAYPPLITSTMQRLAGNRLGWSAKKTMTMAQHLYENGLITYHRTDSVNLAQEAIASVRQYIGKTYGQDYLPDQPNFYKAKSKNVQGAHEAIRPTNISADAAELGKSEQRLYQLIWQRFVASQMSPAVFQKTVVQVQAKAVKEYVLKAEAEKLEFDGWMKVTDGFKLTEVNLPPLMAGDKPQLIKVLPEQKFTQPPARYTEASLIKELEKRGIGRPSTYAPILSTIQDRYYVEKVEQKLHPTAIGETVTMFLLKHFAEVMDYDFTAKMEDDLDQIALGKLKSQELLKSFYLPFDKKLIQVTEKAERAKIATESTGEKCPDCDEGEIVIRLGRFGKFLSCSRFPECKYTAKYKDVVEGVLCPQDGAEVVVKKTRRGKSFYGCGNYPNCKWASWKKP
ncbi:MAG: type I DNA topoisomerase, partial [Candidatus Beckwithbacteria bacterium]|nr:type I DNA topoisomerase [Candidatus Beckwithbacteria bacterium]